MLIIGHRGAAGLAKENTMDALRAGVKSGADILEFDVRLTKDDIPVVIHDPTTARTHGERVVVASHTLSELQSMHFSQPILLLSEVLDEFFGHVLLNIELKSRGCGVVVTDLIAKRYIKKQSDWHAILISSFKVRELIQVRRRSNRIPIALLHNQNPFIFIAYERYLHFTAVGFHRLYTNPLATEIAKRAGIFCYAYTVDRPYGALLLHRKGIDGVVTNRPDIILSDINKQNERP